MEDSQSGQVAGGEGGSSAAPVLLDQQLLPEFVSNPTALSIGAIAALVMVALGAFGLTDPMLQNEPPASPKRVQPSVIRLSPSDAPGLLHPVDPVVANMSVHVFNMLAMPGSEKARLKQKLADSPVRIGAVTLWDTVDEDGDQVTVSAAGFTQTLTILHKPETFFVPYLPGGTLRISGVRDGGGGITLGAQTSLGRLPLPYLSVGQILEVGLP